MKKTASEYDCTSVERSIADVEVAIARAPRGAVSRAPSRLRIP